MKALSIGYVMLSAALGLGLAACGSGTDSVEGQAATEKAAISVGVRDIKPLTATSPAVEASEKKAFMEAPAPTRATPEQVKMIRTQLEAKLPEKAASTDPSTLLQELKVNTVNTRQ